MGSTPSLGVVKKASLSRLYREHVDAASFHILLLAVDLAPAESLLLQAHPSGLCPLDQASPAVRQRKVEFASGEGAVAVRLHHRGLQASTAEKWRIHPLCGWHGFSNVDLKFCARNERCFSWFETQAQAADGLSGADDEHVCHHKWHQEPPEGHIESRLGFFNRDTTRKRILLRHNSRLLSLDIRQDHNIWNLRRISSLALGLPEHLLSFRWRGRILTEENRITLRTLGKAESEPVECYLKLRGGVKFCQCFTCFNSAVHPSPREPTSPGTNSLPRRAAAESRSEARAGTTTEGQGLEALVARESHQATSLRDESRMRGGEDQTTGTQAGDLQIAKGAAFGVTHCNIFFVAVQDIKPAALNTTP